MTDEERRQKLVANLYSLSRDDDRATLCYDAADEIERLAAENAELRKTQLTFRTIERQPFTIKDEP